MTTTKRTKLTEDQFQKLETLKKEFPKYEILLNDAIDNWRNGIDPVTDLFNIVNINKKLFPINTHTSDSFRAIEYGNCACLVGASLMNKEVLGDFDNFESLASEVFNISISEIENIISGFDGFVVSESKANDFGFLVHKIIFDFDEKKSKSI